MTIHQRRLGNWGCEASDLQNYTNVVVVNPAAILTTDIKMDTTNDTQYEIGLKKSHGISFGASTIERIETSSNWELDLTELK